MVAVESQKIKDVEGTLFGSAISTTSTQSLTDIKALMKRLNDVMGQGEWLVGGRMTLADIVAFCSLATLV
jgi:glutathione S-transferase